MLQPAPITLHYTTFHLNDNITLVKNIGAMGKEDNKTRKFESFNVQRKI